MNPVLVLSFIKNYPKIFGGIVWILSIILTAGLVWIYKPTPPMQSNTTASSNNTEVRYIDRFTYRPDGSIASKETVKETIDKSTTFSQTKIEEPKYLVGLTATFRKELKWEYSVWAGKVIFPQTYLIGGVTVDATMAPQAVSVGIIKTFRSIPFIE